MVSSRLHQRKEGRKRKRVAVALRAAPFTHRQSSTPCDGTESLRQSEITSKHATRIYVDDTLEVMSSSLFRPLHLHAKR